MRLGPMAVALLLLPAARASAEWQIKPFVAATFKGGTTLALLDPALVAGDTKPAFGVGAVVLGEIFGIEGELGRTPGFFESGKDCNPFSTKCPVIVVSSSVTTFTGNLVVAMPRRLTEYSLRPYVVAGGGMIRARSETSIVLPAAHLAALDVGGGAVGFFTNDVGVGWDLRYFHSLHGKTPSVLTLGDRERLSFWRVNMAFVVRLRHSK